MPVFSGTSYDEASSGDLDANNFSNQLVVGAAITIRGTVHNPQVGDATSGDIDEFQLGVSTDVPERRPANAPAPGDTIQFTLTAENYNLYNLYAGSTTLAEYRDPDNNGLASHSGTITGTFIMPAGDTTIEFLGAAPSRIVGGSVITNDPVSYTLVLTNLTPPSSTNRPPVANADAANTKANTPTKISVLGNDTDPDGDTLTVSVSSTTTPHGSVLVNADKTITYTPVTGFTGTDTFDYGISDGHSHTASATVTVTVASSNRPPVAVADSASVVGGESVTVNVLTNDSDPDGDALIISASGNPANGIAVLAGAQITYTPNAGFVGTDSVSYTISDGHGGNASSTASFNVTAPTAADIRKDPIELSEDTGFVAQAGDAARDFLIDAGLKSSSAIKTEINATSALFAESAQTFANRFYPVVQETAFDAAEVAERNVKYAEAIGKTIGIGIEVFKFGSAAYADYQQHGGFTSASSAAAGKAVAAIEAGLIGGAVAGGVVAVVFGTGAALTTGPILLGAGVAAVTAWGANRLIEGVFTESFRSLGEINLFGQPLSASMDSEFSDSGVLHASSVLLSISEIVTSSVQSAAAASAASAISLGANAPTPTWQFDVVNQTFTVLDPSINATLDRVTTQLGLTATPIKLTITGDADPAALNDLIYGGGNDDTLSGGQGSDLIFGKDGNDLINGGSGDDLLLGGGGADTVNGGDGVDLISGGTGNDTLDGGIGNDTLDGGTGSDKMTGGVGDDTFYVDNAADTVVENANEGTDRIVSSINLTLINNVEQLELSGSANSATGNAAANTLIGTDGGNTLDGSGGADVMIGRGGDDSYFVENGGDVVLESPGGGYDRVLAFIDYTLTDNVERLDLFGANTNGTGNADANMIVGNATTNVINGGGGADQMIGKGGDDIYYVDNAGDVVTEIPGEGNDTILALVNFTLPANVERLELMAIATVGTGNSGANTLIGNDSGNTLDGSGGSDLMIGRGGDDSYYVDNVGDIVLESPGGGYDRVLAFSDYTLTENVERLELFGAGTSGTGNGEANTIIGNNTGNIINGGAGADVMIGRGGDDTYYVDNPFDTPLESPGEGTDKVFSSVSYSLTDNIETLELLGTTANGTGNGGSNTLIGNAAANILDGGGGADTMIGKVGDDIYYVDNAGDIVTENPGEGGDTIRAYVNFTLSANVERLELLGAVGGGTGNAAANTLIGNDSANVLDGSGGVDLMIGRGGDDSYFADNAGDIVLESANGGYDRVLAFSDYTLTDNVERLELFGAGTNGTGNGDVNTIIGNDTGNIINGGAGADVMIGRGGDDIYFVDNVGDAILESAGGGYDQVYAFTNYTLSDNVERLQLYGTASVGTGNGSANTIIGNGNDNVVNGGGGADLMIGAAGNDIYFVDNAGDVVQENSGEGSDVIWTFVNYALPANVERLELVGNGAINATGRAVADTLIGNDSANVLDGSGGVDLMIGRGGDDTYFADNAGDIVLESAGGGYDRVLAFSDYSLTDNVERLELYGAGTNGTGNGDANTVIGNDTGNVINGGGGADLMIGRGGDDIYFVDNVGDVILESPGGGYDQVYAFTNYTLSDNVERLQLFGSAVNGTGSSGADTIIGNDSDNIINGSGGADLMLGGLGGDTYFVDNTADVVTENLNQGSDTILSFVDYAAPVNVERLELVGNGAINGSGNAAGNILIGNDNNNVINGNGGADLMIGRGGNDLYFVDNTSDVVLEIAGDGYDQVWSYVDVTLTDNVEGLTLLGPAIRGTGNAGNNTIVGNGQDNILSGGGGSDVFVLSASFGKDTISDFTAGTASDDVIRFGDGLFSSFADVMAHASQVGSDVVITHDASNILSLTGVSLANLHANDFLLI